MTRTIFPDDTARVRKSDPVTSHLAADTNDVAASRDAVAAELAKVDFGLADFELERRLADRFSAARIRTARKELVDQGKVEFTGAYHLTPSRRHAQVWWLT